MMNPKRFPLNLKQFEIGHMKSWVTNNWFWPKKHSKMTSTGNDCKPIVKPLKVARITQESRVYVTGSGTPGSGAGKGGGAGGAVKEGGGGLGRFGAAQEEGYFYNKGREQIEKLKKALKPETKDDSKDEGNKNQQG